MKEEFERYKFYSRVQLTNEPFDKFLAALRNLISACNFHDGEKDKALRDRIVFGIQSKAVREELFNVPDDLTLEKCVEVCQRFEATKQYLDGIDKVSFDSVNKADAVTSSTISRRPQQQPRNQSQGHSSQQQRTSIPITHHQSQNLITNCNYCGGSHPPRKCPAYNKICNSCGRKGHFGKVCKSTMKGKTTPNSTVNEVTPDVSECSYAIKNQLSSNKE